MQVRLNKFSTKTVTLIKTMHEGGPARTSTHALVQMLCVQQLGSRAHRPESVHGNESEKCTAQTEPPPAHRPPPAELCLKGNATALFGREEIK